MRNKIYKLALYFHRLGLSSAFKINLSMFLGKKGSLLSLSVPGIKHPVHIRAQSSDEYTFQQIFVNKEYNFRYAGNPKFIIDAGSNIGLAAVYFANRFPESQIICLEPEPNNFKLLQQNISPYKNISALQVGLWNKSAFLSIRDRGLGNWGFIVEEAPAGTKDAIEAVSVNDLIEKYKINEIDILKMDIEGSEKEVLDAPDAAHWLSRSKVLVIELHDRMKPGTSTSLFKALLNYDIATEQKGENLICYLNKEMAGV